MLHSIYNSPRLQKYVKVRIVNQKHYHQPHHNARKTRTAKRTKFVIAMLLLANALPQPRVKYFVSKHSNYMLNFLQLYMCSLIIPYYLLLACKNDEECTGERICEDKGNGPVCCKPFKGI